MGKVLILDDDEAIVAGLTMALEDEGLAVVSTTSPFQLPFLLRREQPDVVLIDLGMPTLRGERVFEALTPSLRGTTRFLVFSGYPSADLAEVARATGCVDFIQKGDDFGAIVRRIHFWADPSSATARRYIPHIAVITTRPSDTAAVLRSAGYLVTQHAPGELPPATSDVIVVDTQQTRSALRNAKVEAPVIVSTLIPSEDLISVVDRTLARASVA